MQDHTIKKRSIALAAAFITAVTAAGAHTAPLGISVTSAITAAAEDTGSVKIESSGGWNEMLYMVISGISHSDVTGVLLNYLLLFV